MNNKQSWKTCKYSMGDLDIELSERLNNKLCPNNLEEVFLRGEGINRFYYCKCNELINLGAYKKFKIPDKQGNLSILAQLFSLEFPNDDEYLLLLGADLLTGNKSPIEHMIKAGLRACTHCKFYERR